MNKVKYIPCDNCPYDEDSQFCKECEFIECKAALWDLFDVCDGLMEDSNLSDDDGPEMKAMQRAAAVLDKG